MRRITIGCGHHNTLRVLGPGFGAESEVKGSNGV